MLTALGMICAAVIFLCFPWPAARAEKTSDWTVLFYVAGSNLESVYSYATENLKEIATCHNIYAEKERLAREKKIASGEAPEPGRLPSDFSRGKPSRKSCSFNKSSISYLFLITKGEKSFSFRRKFACFRQAVSLQKRGRGEIARKGSGIGGRSDPASLEKQSFLN